MRLVIYHRFVCKVVLATVGLLIVTEATTGLAIRLPSNLLLVQISYYMNTDKADTLKLLELL